MKLIISLKDYEELKEKADKYERSDNYYLDVAVKQIELLE